MFWRSKTFLYKSTTLNENKTTLNYILPGPKYMLVLHKDFEKMVPPVFGH